MGISPKSAVNAGQAISHLASWLPHSEDPEENRKRLINLISDVLAEK